MALSDSVNPAAGRRAAVVDPSADASAVIDERERAARAAAARRRTFVIAGLGGGLLAIALAWFFVLRDRSTPCAAWLGDADELSAYADGAPVRPAFSGDGAFGCHEAYRIGKQLGDGASLATEANGAQLLAARAADEARRDYAEHVALAIPGQGGDAYVFLAGAQQGDRPPSQHVALFVVGDQLVTVRLDRTAFSADNARALVLAIARRARG